MSPKVKAARRLVESIHNDVDFERYIYLSDHPNEQRALDKLLSDVKKGDRNE